MSSSRIDISNDSSRLRPAGFYTLESMLQSCLIQIALVKLLVGISLVLSIFMVTSLILIILHLSNAHP